MQILMRQIRTASKRPNWLAIADEIKKTLDDPVKPELLEYFQRITASWKHKPDFKAIKRVTAGGISVYVYAAGENAEIWKYVTGGTRPHVIKPRNPDGKLVFPWGGYGSYKPKTSKGGHYGGPGTVMNPVTTVLPQVNHPGNEPREFEKHVARWYKPRFRRHMKNSVARGIRRR